MKIRLVKWLVGVRVSEDQGPFLGVIRIVVYWGLHSGLPVYGAPHFESRSSNYRGESNGQDMKGF